MQESNVRFLPCNWTWNLGNFGKVMSALSWYGSMMFVPLSYAIWVIFIFTWFCCTLLLCKSRFRDVVLDVCPSLHGWSIPVSQYIVTLQNQTSIKWLIYISISARLFFFFFFLSCFGYWYVDDEAICHEGGTGPVAGAGVGHEGSSGSGVLFICQNSKKSVI